MTVYPYVPHAREYADTTPCSHPTVHGPTPAGTWVCNRCGFEIITSGRDDDQ